MFLCGEYVWLAQKSCGQGNFSCLYKKNFTTLAQHLSRLLDKLLPGTKSENPAQGGIFLYFVPPVGIEPTF